MSFLWNDHQSGDEIMHKLLCANMELQAARSEAKEEIKRNKETIRELIETIKSVCRERDEARDKLQLLLTMNVSASGYHCINKNVPVLRPEPSNFGSDLESEILHKLGMAKPLPQKGRLLQAVVGAGPLLQSLLIGPVPKWRNPPPLRLLESPKLPIREAVALPLPGGLVGESSIPSPSSVLNVGRGGHSFSGDGIRQYRVATTGKRRMIQ